MASVVFDKVKISGVACAVPKEKYCSADFTAEFGEEEVRKFIEMTGVKERYATHEKQTASDLCYEAARKLIDHKGYEADSFDGLIFVSQTPDYHTPATALVLHKRLGLKKDCVAFDVNLGCSAYVYGVYLMASLVASGAVKRGLLLVGDAGPYRKRDDDHSNNMLFGSAGSATIIESGDEQIKCLMKSDGTGYKVMITPGGESRFPIDEEHQDWSRQRAFMDGEETFLFSITKVPSAIKEFMKDFSCSVDDFDYFAFHQANLFMLKHIAKKIKLPEEKMPVSIDRFGNTTAASIAVTITDLCQNREVPEVLRLVLCGFGIGLSWGVVSCNIESKDVLPIIHTDEYFEEAFDE